MNFGQRLNSVIPGGAHTYSRGDDQFPSNAPQILESGRGVYVKSPDGREFLDYGMALRAIGIGYSNDEINQAAIEEIKKGNNLTRASMTELLAAELISETIPNAEMVKFCKNGSTATTAAVKLARAYTGRKLVARCSQHPFFSYDDWFIGSTVMGNGVPDEISQMTVQFDYNSKESLNKVFLQYGKLLACIILEPSTTELPSEDYLLHIRKLCDQYGVVFILDEMITGFRYHLKGAQYYFKVNPDLLTFGKAMANGFSVAALVGRRKIMDLGGIKNSGQKRIFLISSTHGAEMSGLGALIKTIEIYKREPVTDHMWAYGKKLIKGANEIALSIGIEKYFSFSGVECSPVYNCRRQDGTLCMAFRTLFNQEMIRNGVLIPWVAISYSHKEEHLNITLSAIEKSLRIYKSALENGIDKYLVGDVIKPVFREIN
jgi:glutamate-1-semialdehyde 2,1-aminomutase